MYGCSSPIRVDTSVIPAPPYAIVIRYKEKRSYSGLKTHAERVTATKEDTIIITRSKDSKAH